MQTEVQDLKGRIDCSIAEERVGGQCRWKGQGCEGELREMQGGKQKAEEKGTQEQAQLRAKMLMLHVEKPKQESLRLRMNLLQIVKAQNSVMQKLSHPPHL